MLRDKNLIIAMLIICMLSVCEYAFSYPLEDITQDIVGKISVMRSLDNERTLYVSTDKGLFVMNEKFPGWERVEIPPAIDKIVDIGIKNDTLYIVEENGLYERCSDMSWKRILKKQGLKGLSIFSSTEGTKLVISWSDRDIFIKKHSWEKLNTHNIDTPINTVASYDSSVYMSDRYGVFISRDEGKSWDELISLGKQEDEDTFLEGESDEKYQVRSREDINVSGGGNGTIIVDNGIFVINRNGLEPFLISTSGVPSSEVRIARALPEGIFISTGTKVFFHAFDKNGWIPVFTDTVSGGIVDIGLLEKETGGKYLVVCGKYRIYRINIESLLHDRYYLRSEKVLPDRTISFGEVSVREVHKMAIEYAEVSPEKIRKWRTGAKWKAILPKLSVSYSESSDDNVEIYKSASKYYVVTGPKESGSDWSIDVTWDLADIIWNNEQTNIDVRSRLMVQLRDDILEEVTRLYFERKKLINEVTRLENEDIYKSSSELMDKKLRIEEVTAYIDAMTGGKFSKALKEYKAITYHGQNSL